MSKNRSGESKNVETNLFALVKWIGGDYDKTCTAGVPVEWIFDFDPKTFNPNNDDDESYVIEWRDGKKPKNGWAHFDAQVLQISDNIKKLKKQITVIEETVSPLRPVKTLKSLKDQIRNVKVSKLVLPLKRKPRSVDNTGASTSGLFNSRTKRSKGLDGQNLDEILTITSRKTLLDKNSESRKRTMENNNSRNNQGEDRSEEHSEEEIGEYTEEEVGDQLSSESEDDDENTFSQESQRNGTDMILRTLIKLRKEIKEVKETQANMMNAQMNQGVQNENRNDQVEVGHQGSQVFVTRAQWDTADSRETFEKMGVSLVSCLFETEVLLASNLRGGKSKINKNAPQKPALDQIIISAIQEAVKNKFPATFKKSLFGMAINNYITALRRQHNQPAEENAPEEPVIDPEQ